MKIKIIKQLMLSAIVATSLLLGACASSSIFENILTGTSNFQLAAPISMAIDTATNRLYVVNSNNTVLYGNGSLLIFDVTDPINPVLVNGVALPNFSGQIVLDTVRKFIFIPNRLSDNKNDVLDQVIRVNIDEVSAQFLTVNYFAATANPFGIVFNAANDLYVAAYDGVLRYDADDLSGYSLVSTNFTTAASDPVDGTLVRELAVGPSGDNLYVSNRGDQLMILSIAEITAPIASTITDLSTGPVQYVLSDTGSTRGIAVDSATSKVYVVDGSPPNLLVLDDQALAANVGAAQEISAGTMLSGSVALGDDPSEIVLDTVNDRAYISNTGDDTISVIDTNLLVEVARLSVVDDLPAGITAGDEPFGLALANLGGTVYLYVSNLASHTISILDTSSLTWVGNIP